MLSDGDNLLAPFAACYLLLTVPLFPLDPVSW
jgi:hypothetical protein